MTLTARAVLVFHLVCEAEADLEVVPEARPWAYRSWEYQDHRIPAFECRPGRADLVVPERNPICVPSKG